MAGKPTKPTVLIVDDDPGIRKMIYEVLSLEGYPIESAAGGQEALDMLANGRPRVILLDLLMEPLSGWDVMRELEARPNDRKHHKVILVSAMTNLERARDLRTEGRLPKPFTVDQLLNAIEAVGVPA